ncbi:hypothetical protein [Bradyrhizobium sp. CCBAU 51753]|uniref:hypothetical protein n=1 Tax=Bradyrhizobium sp. CCBAU 51753 TaxID=1325100 RepID=UPI00188D1D88|nr:hypothetical protein [Bradyrhizobium sp. CCBAU 51753]
MPTSTCISLRPIADHQLARRGASPVPFESIGSGYAKLPFSSLIGGAGVRFLTAERILSGAKHSGITQLLVGFLERNQNLKERGQRWHDGCF